MTENVSEITDKELMNKYEKLSTEYALYFLDILKRIKNKCFDSTQYIRFIELQKNISVSILDKLEVKEKEMDSAYKSFSNTLYNKDR